MTRYTEVDGVYFTEEQLPLTVLGRVEARASTQNTTLAEVKKNLAQQAKSLGGNGVVGLVYGQKADSPLKNLFSFKWDTERMKASGSVVKFDSDPRD